MPELSDIARRKERIEERCARQRESIAAAFSELRQPLAIADRGIDAARFLRAHPLLVVAGVALVVALRRRNLITLAVRGVAAWRAWRTVSAWLEASGTYQWMRARGAGRS